LVGVNQADYKLINVELYFVCSVMTDTTLRHGMPPAFRPAAAVLCCKGNSYILFLNFKILHRRQFSKERTTALHKTNQKN